MTSWSSRRGSTKRPTSTPTRRAARGVSRRRQGARSPAVSRRRGSRRRYRRGIRRHLPGQTRQPTRSTRDDQAPGGGDAPGDHRRRGPLPRRELELEEIVMSSVRMRRLDRREIEAYVASKRWAREGRWVRHPGSRCDCDLPCRKSDQCGRSSHGSHACPAGQGRNHAAKV